MARESRRAQLAEARSWLLERERERLQQAPWRRRFPYFADRIQALQAGEPVTVTGYLLGDFRPPSVGMFDQVRLEPDGTLTVTYRVGGRP